MFLLPDTARAPAAITRASFPPRARLPFRRTPIVSSGHMLMNCLFFSHLPEREGHSP